MIARGIRNAYGFAWDYEDRLFSISNGPDVDQPKELDFIRPGRHYSFPYQYGNVPASGGRPYPPPQKSPSRPVL